MPKAGKRMAGSMAAVARGMTSVIQKMAISSRTKEHCASCADTHTSRLSHTPRLPLPGCSEGSAGLPLSDRHGDRH